MDEATAKTKWCPMMHERYEVSATDVADLRLRDIPNRNCIGSACMMWRVQGWMNKEESIPVNASTQWEYPIHKLKPSDDAELHGYCGLAGKP